MPYSDSPSDSEHSVAPDSALPPVQPPSASFILQLFIIPAVIVLVVILVWLAFHWLAHMGSNPAEMIREMRQNKANSWQLAYNFSEELRLNEASRSDRELAEELASFLNQLLDEPLPPNAAEGSLTSGNPRDHEIVRRGFLCKALGEFMLPEVVLPVLIRAASTNSDDDELRVRLAALEAIALLIENTRHQEPTQNKALETFLLAVSEHPDHKITTRAAVALSSMDNDRARKRLAAMLQEPQHVDVHYNVAMGLARSGDVACLETLIEMLDPNEQRALVDEPNEDLRNLKRTRILLNALRASHMLAEQNREADLTVLQDAVNRLIQAEDNVQIQMQGNITLGALQDRNHS